MVMVLAPRRARPSSCSDRLSDRREVDAVVPAEPVVPGGDHRARQKGRDLADAD
jgi:hypothetical protein